MATVLNLRRVEIEEPTARAPVADRVLVRGPQLTELRAFCAALDLGSIGRAARLMHISQPALSKRLHMLEALAGSKLLERSPRGVTATATGATLYVAARRLLTEADSLEALMLGFSTRADPVRVLASPTIADCWLPSALAAFEARHEGHLSVELLTANSTTVRGMVIDGRGDVGLAAVDPNNRTPAGLTEAVVWSDEVVVAVPCGHPWAAEEEIDLDEFARTPIIRRDPRSSSSQLVDATFKAAGITPAPPLAEIGSTAGARATAMAEGAPVLLSSGSLSDEPDGGLVARRIAGMRLKRQFALIVAGRLQDLTPSARALVHFLLGRPHVALKGHGPSPAQTWSYSETLHVKRPSKRKGIG